eukprot:7785217-Pyramimonas_sp.AAC.1
MAEAVDPAAAAPAGHASVCSDTLSTGTDVACDTDAPIGPRYVVTEEMDLSTERWDVYRAGSVGWVKARIIKQRLSSDITLDREGKGHYR